MDFESALQALKSGAQVYRLGWHSDKCITLNEDALYMGGKSEIPVDFVRPWFPSNADMLADDWELV